MIAKLTRPSSGGSSSRGDCDPSYAVTAPSTKNGDVTVSPKNASKGDRVTITVTPDKGYELDKLTVKDASGNKLKLTVKGNGKYTFTMPGGKVTVSAEFVEEQAASVLRTFPPTLTMQALWLGLFRRALPPVLATVSLAPTLTAPVLKS